MKPHRLPPQSLPPNVLMLGASPGKYVFKAVSSVRPADLEQALMCLPFTSALALLGYLKDWLQVISSAAWFQRS